MTQHVSVDFTYDFGAEKLLTWKKQKVGKWNILHIEKVLLFTLTASNFQLVTNIGKLSRSAAIDDKSRAALGNKNAVAFMDAN